MPGRTAGTVLSLRDARGGFDQALWRLRVVAGAWSVDADGPLPMGPLSAIGGTARFALTASGGRLTMYRSGQPAAVVRYSPQVYAAGEVHVGFDPATEQEFPGEIQALDIYDVALSAEQVASLAGVGPCRGCLIEGVCQPPGARQPEPGACGTCVPAANGQGWTDTCDQGAVDAAFDDFREGRAVDGGADLLIAADGTVRPLRNLELSGDDWPDLAFAPAGPGILRVFHGGPAGYADPADVALNIAGATLHDSADIDGDGHTDLVLLEGSAGADAGPRIFWGGPQGLSADRTTRLIQSRPSGLAIGDVDGDGRPDIAVSGDDVRGVRIFRGQAGDGGRAVDPSPLVLDAGPGGALVLADLDGDRRLDMAIASSGDGATFVLTGERPLVEGALSPSGGPASSPWTSTATAMSIWSPWIPTL